MTDAERQAALQALETIRPILKKIGQGWLFCLDRGYGWTIEMEEREGRSTVATALAAHPILQQRLTKAATQLANGDLLGDVDSLDEVDATIAFLQGGSG